MHSHLNQDFRDFQDREREVAEGWVHLAPVWNPDLSGRGDMCHLSESRIRRIQRIARIIALMWRLGFKAI